MFILFYSSGSCRAWNQLLFYLVVSGTVLVFICPVCKSRDLYEIFANVAEKTLFGVVEGMIFTGYVQRGESGCDYLIVLGAQMKPDGPSRVLQYRLDAAYDYLEENPDTKVIVSGGQGSDEIISEAQGMYDYLAGRGIEKERIIREDQSVNTVQNLKYSAEFLDREQDSVCIVSNNFHMFRARRLAEKLGYQKVCGLAAKGDPVLMANNMLREFFGVMKDFIYGNL